MNKFLKLKLLKGLRLIDNARMALLKYKYLIEVQLLNRSSLILEKIFPRLNLLDGFVCNWIIATHDCITGGENVNLFSLRSLMY